MSDVVIAALITVGGMVAVVVFNELAHWLREKIFRKKMFFKDFFPERLKAHQEIMRAVAESGIGKPLPYSIGAAGIKQFFNAASQRLEDAAFNSSLIVDNAVFKALLALAMRCAQAADAVEESGGADVEAIGFLQDDYDEFIKLLREKSGVGIIDQEFAKTLKGRRDDETYFYEKPPGQKKRP